MIGALVDASGPCSLLASRAPLEGDGGRRSAPSGPVFVGLTGCEAQMCTPNMCTPNGV